MHRRRERCSRLFFSGLRRYIGHRYRCQCSISSYLLSFVFLSFSLPPLLPPCLLIFSAPFLRRPIIIRSDCNVGKYANRTNRPAACSRDRSAFRGPLFWSDLDPPGHGARSALLRNLSCCNVGYNATARALGGPYSRHAFNAKWDYLILVTHWRWTRSLY